MTVDEIRRVRFSQVIKDPFPEHSHYEQIKGWEKIVGGWFGKSKLSAPPEPISIWAAYQMGYEKAYEEMLAAADLMPSEKENSQK